MSPSPFLGGGFDVDLRKPCPSPSPRSSQFSSTSFSPSGESSCSSSSLAIITKKSRAPRKRLNQSYSEAAALLSAVFPNIFPSNPIHRRRSPSPFPEAPAELLLHSPFPSLAGGDDASLFLPRRPPENPACSTKPTRLLFSSVQSSSQSSSPGSGFITEPAASSLDGDVFDPESMFGEGAVEDIDGIMGKLALSSCTNSGAYRPAGHIERTSAGFGVELRRRALRRAEEDDDDGGWWRLPRVAVRELIPKLEPSSPAPPPSAEMMEEKGQKNKRYPSIGTEEKFVILGLKLNYEEVFREWADRGSPFAGEIELLPEPGGGGGGGREASVQRYRDKRSRRVSFGKIRYQVRKVSADKRPRVKGRFVKAEEAAVASSSPTRGG